MGGEDAVSPRGTEKSARGNRNIEIHLPVTQTPA